MILRPEFKVVRRKRTCDKCGGDVMCKLVRDISQSGVSMVYWYCETCEYAAKTNGRYIGHKKLEAAKIDPELLPIVNNYSGNELCAVCGSPFTEYHHWAPRHLFFDDADHWPGAYLCKKHHDQWHKTVTPAMGHWHKRVEERQGIYHV